MYGFASARRNNPTLDWNFFTRRCVTRSQLPVTPTAEYPRSINRDCKHFTPLPADQGPIAWFTSHGVQSPGVGSTTPSSSGSGSTGTTVVGGGSTVDVGSGGTSVDGVVGAGVVGGSTGTDVEGEGSIVVVGAGVVVVGVGSPDSLDAIPTGATLTATNNNTITDRTVFPSSRLLDRRARGAHRDGINADAVASRRGRVRRPPNLRCSRPPGCRSR